MRIPDYLTCLLRNLLRNSTCGDVGVCGPSDSPPTGGGWHGGKAGRGWGWKPGPAGTQGSWPSGGSKSPFLRLFCSSEVSCVTHRKEKRQPFASEQAERPSLSEVRGAPLRPPPPGCPPGRWSASPQREGLSGKRTWAWGAGALSSRQDPSGLPSKTGALPTSLLSPSVRLSLCPSVHLSLCVPLSLPPSLLTTGTPPRLPQRIGP